MTKRQPIASLPNIVRRVLVDPVSKAEREYFVGTLRSDLAKALTFVPVKEASSKTYLTENLDKGYQRPGSAARMRGFGKYVSENPLSVVPPIILSGRDDWTFSGKDNYGSLEIFGPAAVVDGQHRMGGYVYLFETDQQPRQVDFILLGGLSLKEETEEFLAINDTQKGVPRSLNVLLQGSDESVIAVALDESDDSPFKDRITQVKKSKGDLFSLAAVAKNMSRTFEHGAFDGADLDKRLEIVIAYWDIIADAFPEEWADMDRTPQEFKLLETTGLIAWSLSASDILGPAFDPVTKTVNWDMVRAKVAAVAIPGALDWRKTGEFQGLTGEVGGARIHKKIQALLAAAAADEA